MNMILQNKNCTVLGDAGPVIFCGIGSYDAESKEKIRDIGQKVLMN